MSYIWVATSRKSKKMKWATRRRGVREGGREGKVRYERAMRSRKTRKRKRKNKRKENAIPSSQSHSTRHEKQVKENKSVSLAAFLLSFT